MKKAGMMGNLNGIVFFVALLVIFSLEMFGKVVERGVGYYLKWENYSRPQLGRIWEKDREKIVAQKKIETLLSSLNTQETSSDSIQSFKELFEQLNPAVPQMVSRKKFLQLYFEFPEQLSRKIISPYELLEIDSNRDWQRVLLTQLGEWITVSFINNQNYPIREVFMSADGVGENPLVRDIFRGTLEEAGFGDNSILPFSDFMRVLKTLGSETQETLFPDPSWFFSKNYHVTRVGIKETPNSNEYPPPARMGVEYQSDFFTEVLILPVPGHISENLLSQIEIPVIDEAAETVSPFGDFQGESN
ncbi:MAG: hypothetical protein OEZ51_00655 [Nitrospinota bacterium]|nr:hypothetical protein [Nitrospinota bacterium]